MNPIPVRYPLGGGFIKKNHPDPWGDDPIWRAYFSNGLKPPTSRVFDAGPFLGPENLGQNPHQPKNHE